MSPKIRRTIEYLLTVVFAQGLSFLLLPIVTRFLSPEAYGEYALALAISGLVGMIASGWVRNVGLRLYYDAAERGSTRGFYVGTALLQAVLALGLYALTLGGMALLGFELASMNVMLAAGLALLAGDQHAWAVTLLRAEERSTAFAVAEVGNGLVRFGVTVGGLYAGIVRPELLFVAMALAYLTGSLIAIPVLWRRLSGPLRLDRRGVRETLRAGPSALPFSVAAWLDQLSSRLVLQFFLGTAVVGVFSVGYSIGERLVGALTQAVFMMAWPSVLNAWREGGVKAAREALLDAQRIFAWLTVGPVAFLVLFGPELTRWLAGPDFQEAAVVVPVVAAAMWFRAFSSYLNRHLELNKRFARISLYAMSAAVLNVVLSIVLVPRVGMVGAAIASATANLALLVTYFVIRDPKLTGIKGSAFLGAGGLSALAYGASWLVKRTMPDAPYVDEYAMGAFVLIYAVGALVMLFGSGALLRRVGLAPRPEPQRAPAAPGSDGEDER